MMYSPQACGALCDKCLLKGSTVVPPETYKTPQDVMREGGSQIVVVGEAPGEQEERQERPFVGPSGWEMDKALRQAGVNRRDIHVTNTLLCRPPNNDVEALLRKVAKLNQEAVQKAFAEDREPPKPIPTPLECCRPRLEKELENHRDFITMGKYATNAIAGTSGGILRIRGGLMTLEATDLTPARRVMPTIHPAFVLRQKRWSHVFRNDIHKAVQWFRGLAGWQPPTVRYQPTPDELDAFLRERDLIVYDVETDGIECLTARIRCVGVGDQSVVYVVSFCSIQGHPLVTHAEYKAYVDVLRKYFEDPKITKVGHNCLFLGTPVRLPDGKSMPIEKLVRSRYAGEVLALNKAGELVSARVTDWFREPAPGQKWVVIRREGEKAHARGLTLTPDHMVYTPEGLKRADAVRPGDYLLDQERLWDEDERQALLGTLLGDSSAVSHTSKPGQSVLRDLNSAPTAVIRGSHTSFALVHEKNQWLNGLFAVHRDAPGGFGTNESLAYRTPQCRQAAELARLVYTGTKRRLSASILDQLGPVGLAWLYADDGFKHSRPNRKREAVLIATCGFSAEDRAEAQAWFSNHFGATTQTAEGSLRLGVDAAQRFAAHIAPFLLPAARYKLPRGQWPDFVGFPARNRKPLPVRVESVVEWDAPRDTLAHRSAANTRWCIQTTEGNFLTSFGVVKNSGYYDRIVMREQFGINVEPNVDTMVLHRNVESELPHSLAHVASIYTTAPAWKCDREGNKLALGGESDEQLAEYNANDVAITARVLTPLAEQVRLRDQVGVWKIDQRMQALCADMHTVGMFVDQPVRLREERRLLSLRHDVLQVLQERLGSETFNPGSVYQLRDLLFKKWQLQPPVEDEERFTASGDPSTGDFILRSLLSDKTVKDEQREIIKLVRRYRKLQKVLGTYVCKLRPWDMEADLGWDEDDDWVDKETRDRYGQKKQGIVNPRTGRMYPGYNAHVAVTGRLSSSKPINAQNFPKALRSLVTAAPGHILVGADMNQLELRIAAALWEVELYLRAFAEGKDPHSMTAFAVFGEAFCTAAGIDAKAFEREGMLVGTSYDEHGKFIGTGEDKKMRDLSKAVQYASVSKGSLTSVLDGRRAVPIEEVKPGDWTWAWSTKRLRYEPTQVKNVWSHGQKPCVRVTFEWNASKRGGKQQASVVVTSDHPMLLRNNELRHAGTLKAGDRLMPFRRRETPMQRPSGTTYRHIHPFNDERIVGEHRVVKGYYEPGDRHTHVHHLDENPLNNHPDNLEDKNYLPHYYQHKDAIDAGRVASEKWRESVADPETRSGASKKAWEGRRERKDTDATFGPRGSVLDAFADKIGVLKDSEVAELAGCSSELVGMYRRDRDMPPPVGQQGWLRWLLANDVLWRRLLHDNTDVEMTRLVKEQFDVEVTRHAVRQTRKLLGVPAVRKDRAGVYPRRVSKLDSWADRVGHESDTAIAAEAGVSAQAVAYFRKSRGIPAYWQECPNGTNHTVVSVEPAGEFEVWDVEVDHEDHTFALEAGIFVHNSQYMAAVETVHKLICKTEVPAKGEDGKPLDDGTTILPYALLPLKRVREMRDNWLKGAPEFAAGWEKEIAEYRAYGFLAEPVGFRRRDFLDGEDPNQIVNFKIQCIPGHIRVLTQDGYIPIRELEGKHFTAWTGKRWASATCISKGTAQLRQVNTTHALSLLCDASHKFKVPNRSSYIWKRTDELILNQRVALDLARPLEFGSSKDEEDAYMAGLWIADGSITFAAQGRERNLYMAWAVGDKSFSGPTSRSGPVQVARIVSWARQKGLNPRVSHGQGCSSVRLYKGARELAETWAINPSWIARTKRVPEWVWRSCLAARKAFLRGVLDGDGYQDPHKAVLLHMCNPELLEDLALLFRTVGVDALSLQGPFKTNAEKPYVAYRLRLAAAHTHAQLGWGEPAKYRSNNTLPQFECARIFERLQTSTSSHRTLKSRIKGHRGAGTMTPYAAVDMRVDDVYDHAAVSFISELSLTTEVFTLSVDDPDHQYVANGFISQNSSAAALMNKAILELCDQIPLHKWGPGTGIINQCHDSIVIECPIDGAYKDEHGKLIAPKGSIPWRVQHMMEEALNQEHPALPGVRFTASADLGMDWKKVG